MSRRLLGLAVLVALLPACGKGEGTPPEDGARGRGLVAQVASYETLAGRDNRVIVGLLTEDNLFVSGGAVRFRFSFLGQEGAAPEPGPEAEATFLPIAEPGSPPPPATVTVGPASIGRGVYSANGVRFDRAGVWQVEVEAAVGEGDVRRATSAFTVLEEPIVPAPGEKAPRTKNLTLESADAPPGAIDSRATASLAEVPDPVLHRATIAGAIKAGRPSLVVFATPVYCISRFCGPVTDMVAGLAQEYADRAEFIHVEIWRDFQGKVINKAAAEWLLHGEDLTEPWVFLIDGDGTILERWDNVATPEEIRPHLERLPAGG